MSEEKNINAGSVKISEEVVASIVAIAVNEVEGANANSAQWGKKNATKGIRVILNEDNVDIEISVQMKFGVIIPQTALHVQQRVKESVESMTGLTVKKIDITVTGVSFDKEKKGE
jgi:uncharacterized alkaline shock family protein YloU